jgi:hypothetical protein
VNTLQKIYFFLVFLCTPYALIVAQEKYIIGTQSWGLFACLFNTLNHLVIAEQQHKIPVIYWGSECPYFDPNGYNGVTNAWEYYFEPVSQAVYNSGDSINKNYVTPTTIRAITEVFGYCSSFSGKTQARYDVNKIMQKYIRVKPTIAQKVSDFYRTYMHGKKTIGIHLRGTDKITECIATPPAEILAFANKKYKGYQFYIATDEEALLNLAKKLLKGPVIAYNSMRSQNGQPIHFYNNNKPRAGEDVLIEAMLLARCHVFLHTSSNVSMGVLCMNPDLENIVFPSRFIK